MSDPLQVAREAERDLNSYQAKTGAGKSSSSDDAGVDTSVESKFPGAQVKYGDDLVTNASYNRRIPEDEGGDLDDRGRQTKGSQFEAEGGPEDKLAKQARDQGGENDQDVLDIPANKNHEADQRVRNQNSKAQFKGEDYYEQESVPDSIADQGNVAPYSVTEASKGT